MKEVRVVNNTARNKQKTMRIQVMQTSEVDLEVVRSYRIVLSHLRIIHSLNLTMNERWSRVVSRFNELSSPDDQISVDSIYSIAETDAEMGKLIGHYAATARRYDRYIEGHTPKVGRLLDALKRRQEMLEQGSYQVVKPLPEVVQAEHEYGLLVKAREIDPEFSKRLSTT